MNKIICKVLLAEDDDDDFCFFNMAISSLEGTFKLLRTSDGIMFSSLIQTSIETDVIFLDINMPFKNGLACLKEIRSMEEYNSINVVMYSTSANTAEIDKCYNLGANFYMIKPSCYSCVKQQLRELFQNDYFLRNIKPSREKFVLQSPESRNNTPSYPANRSIGTC